MDDEINLKDLLDVLIRQKNTILLVLVFFIAASFIATSFMKPLYKSTAKILVRSACGGQASQFAGLAALAGVNVANTGGIGDLSELVNSASVQNTVVDVVEKEASVPVDLGVMKAKATGSFLEITVEHKDPKMAAFIADLYVSSLSQYWNKLNYTEARKKREYIEVQLPVSERNLKNAEDRLKSLTYLSGSSITQQSIDVVRLQREVEIQTSIYLMLRKELENAKLDEAKEVSPFTDVDKAQVPDKPFKPKMMTNMAVGTVLGLFVGLFAAFFRDFFEKSYRR